METLMNPFLKLTPQSFAMIFSMINNNEDRVIYVVDPTYQTNYYLTPSFVNVWDRPLNLLYDDMSAWASTVVEEDYMTVSTDMSAQEARGVIPLNNMCYRIFQPNGQLRWLTCNSFPLYNDENECVAVIGIVDNVEQEKYIHLLDEKNKISNNDKKQSKELSDILIKELAVSGIKQPKTPGIPFDGKPVRKKISIQSNLGTIILSVREAQCLHCLKQGMTAKETGERLFISRRTVEAYLETVKAKFQCTNKYQLIHKAGKIQTEA
jgi:DNA-binding CsgD family transcriptional regulator